jgi:hypothetical protein
MRHLNSGEVKLFNVAKDMGETKDLSNSMPDKRDSMVRNLDAYLKKVGAWTMEEVYETRLDELNKWIGEKQQQISDCQKKLKNSPDNKQIKVQLKQAQDSLSKFQKTRSDVLANQSSSNWL